MGEKSNDKDGSFDCCFGHTFTCCHYTQVVSARTRRVGCGVATCAELEKNGHVIAHNAAYVVCFYEPRQGSYEPPVATAITGTPAIIICVGTQGITMRVVEVVVCCWVLVEILAAATVEDASIAAHNKARRAEATAEHATNMYELVWDAHLAKDAQSWADGCVEEHRNLHGYGENLYYQYPKNQPDAAVLGHCSQLVDGREETGRCFVSSVVSAGGVSADQASGLCRGTCPELRKNGHVIAHNAAYVVCFYEPQ
ncbi:hypothetical protein BaRGS_00020264 [Batillaria attramentaria]|uniref:SCP domain-containing protein n=1 Tax=Batillaria attramentaria TaxID=370345 RepID=A0ABD0KN03_9CAEN